MLEKHKHLWNNSRILDYENDLLIVLNIVITYSVMQIEILNYFFVVLLDYIYGLQIINTFPC